MPGRPPPAADTSSTFPARRQKQARRQVLSSICKSAHHTASGHAPRSGYRPSSTFPAVPSKSSNFSCCWPSSRSSFSAVDALVLAGTYNSWLVRALAVQTPVDHWETALIFLIQINPVKPRFFKCTSSREIAAGVTPWKCARPGPAFPDAALSSFCSALRRDRRADVQIA